MNLKSFKQFVNENEPLFKYKGIKVIDTKHSIERFIQRKGILSKQDFEIIFKRAIDKIKSNFKYYNELRYYLIYSKEYEQGIIIDFRKEKQNKDDKKHIIIITILPNKKQLAKPGTKKMFVESLITEDYDVYEYIYSLLNEDIRDIEYDEINKNNIDYIIVEGEIYDLNVEILEVE